MNEHIGDNQYFWVEVYLHHYPSVYAVVRSTVSVKPCVILSVNEVDSQPTLLETYRILDTESISVEASNFIFTPACEYNLAVTSVLTDPLLTGEQSVFYFYGDKAET